MEARSLPEALKLIMQHRGCSQNQLARDLGKTQSWVSEVINGKRANELAKVIKALEHVGWEVRITPKTEGEDPVKRREFVTAAASAMFVPSPRVGPYQDPSYLQELASRLARDTYEHGGATMASAAIRHIPQLEPLIASKDRTLQAAASGVAMETVWTLRDARRFDVGEKVGRLALELARRSQNADAHSRVHSVLTALNVDRGAKDRALMYAREGVKLRGVSDAQQAWMRLRLAWSLALVREQGHASQESRDLIEGIQVRLAENHGFHGQSAFDVADMTGSVGRTLSALEVYGEAQTYMGEAVRRFGHSSPLVPAVLLAQQTTVALRAGEPSPAAEHMLALARVAPLVNSPRLDRYLNEIHTQSARWGRVPEIRDARGQLAALRTA